MPDLTHLWQRFLLASSLLVGLVIGVAATIFGYSNKMAVDVDWWVFHIDQVPLWSVAVVPLAIVLIAGTLYHWMDGLHHFSEHMRHRHRVHELEVELGSLRAHLDQVLEMPDHTISTHPRKSITVEPLSPAEPAPAAVSAEPALPEAPPMHRRLPRPKRATLAVAAEPTAAPNGGHESTTTKEPAL